jgi:hypothetical protein
MNGLFFPVDRRYEAIRKFGLNPEIDITTTGRDVWDYGFTTAPGVANYPFPSAAAATNIISDDDEDGDGTSTGALTVEVEGLDTNYLIVKETATMTGQTQVVLNTQFLRVYRAKVLTAGSTGWNVGNIDVRHSTTVLARITATRGQTLMAIYTVPADYREAYGISFYASIHKSGAAGTMDFAMQIREEGGAWQTKELIGLSTGGTSVYNQRLSQGVVLKPRTDIRARVLETTSNDSKVSAGFDILLPKR